MRLKDRNIIFLAVFIILGMFLSMQFKNTLKINKQKNAASFDTTEIINSINEQQKIQDELIKSINESIKFKDDFVRMLLERRDNESLLREWDLVTLKAGLTDVTGHGIIIELDDAPARKTEDPGILIIQDTDIKIILNDLRAAGAQAISINNERIIATSEQICAGPTIRINGNRYAVPYIIKAIGEPEKLMECMNNSERVRLMLDDNIRIVITNANDILIPKFKFPERMISGLEVAKK